MTATRGGNAPLLHARTGNSHLPTSQHRRKNEHEAALDWLESNPPVLELAEDVELPDTQHDVVAAVALAGQLRARDIARGTQIKETLLRARLQLAIGHLTGAVVEAERHVPIPQFQGVGPVDLIVRQPDATPAVLIECKWSRDSKRDKIYEAAWDAIKLALAVRAAGQGTAILVTAAEQAAWTASETADLFATGPINTVEPGTGRSTHSDQTAGTPSGLTATQGVGATASPMRPKTSG